MSARSDAGSVLVGNHVPHHRTAALPTVDEDDEETSPEDLTTSTPDEGHDDLGDDGGDLEDGREPGIEEEDDVDEPVAVSSSELTLSETETKETLPNGPTPGVQASETTPGGRIHTHYCSVLLAIAELSVGWVDPRVFISQELLPFILYFI